VWDLFAMAQSQGIPSPAGGIVGLAHGPVAWYMDLLGIPDEARCDAFELFRLLENLYVRHCNRNLKTSSGLEAPREPEPRPQPDAPRPR
jgi:hypothetical protein